MGCFCPRREEHRHLFDRNQPVKIADIWTGKNYLFWNNRLVFGPDWPGLLVSHALIIIPALFFYIFVCRDWFIYVGVIPSIFMVIFGTILLISTLFFLFRTGSMDPGYVQKNISTAKRFFKLDETETMTSNENITPYKEVEVNGVNVRVKWCRSCKIYRPPRTSHCRRCDSCVERFDHHCPWTGTCIGKRNYRYFFGFVSCTTMLCLYAAICCVIEIIVFIWRATLPEKDSRSYKYHDMDTGQAFVQSMLSSPLSYIIIIYGFVMALSVGGLMCFHTYLICKNVTTYESINNIFDSINPFSKGIYANLYEVLFAPVPPSQIRFNDTITLDQENLEDYNSGSEDLESSV
jgi:palmitoyltransferase ZDHHC9/14/18